METQLVLPHNEAHLWFVQLDEVAPVCLETYWDLLSDDEKEGAARLVFETHRNAFVTAHAFVRATLSRYATVAPSDWSFATNDYGRPRVCQPSFGDLDFNLAHSDGIAVCLVGRGIVGVDVEDLFRRAPLDIVDQFFSALEVQSLRQLERFQQIGEDQELEQVFGEHLEQTREHEKEIGAKRAENGAPCLALVHVGQLP